MKSDFDPQRLADIPDPFADAGASSAGPFRVRPAASPTRSHVRAVRAVAFGGALAYEAIGVVVLKARPDLGSMSVWTLALGLLIPLGGVALALGAVARVGVRGLGEPVGRLAALAVGAPALFALATLSIAPPETAGDAFWHRALACLATSAVLAAGPIVLGLWALRNAFAASSAWRTAALGVACGALSAATLSMVCPNGGGLHVLVGHGGMMLAMGIVGGWVGRRITSA